MPEQSHAISRSRLLIGAIGLFALIGAVALGWHWFAGDAPTATSRPGRPPWSAEGDEPVPVRIATAVREPLAVHLKALGTVTPLRTVTVRSRVEGELVRVEFREGEHVKEGQLLAQIDPRSFQVQLEQALGLQQEHLAELANAQGELKRFQDLQDKGYVSAQELSNQEALVRQFEARRKTDQAAVDDARLQLTYTRITAPISGRVGLRAVDAGNLVRVNDAQGIVTITQMRPISVVFTIAEPDLPAVRAAARADPELPVEVWGRDERTRLAVGKLWSLDNQIDTATGTLRARAQFDNADEQLFPNQFVNVRLRVRDDPATVIPNAAVQYGSRGNFVYVIGADNKAAVRNVELGVTEGERVAVTKGLEPGERVVLEGMDGLRDGRLVEIMSESKPDAPS
jgi:multidrug efflux system membrane fusion protein